MSANPRRIDVHHHLQPPKFIAWLNENHPEWTGGPDLPHWTPEIGIEVMERAGIATAIASSVPSVYWGDAALAASFATYCNEYAARVSQDHPRHYGAMGTLPLPDVAAACKEAVYVLDTLGLDAIILNASQGVQYLGDPSYEELMQVLNERDAIVLIHPTTAPPGADVPKLHIPYGLVEFMADTSRAVSQLLFNGVFERYPRIRWIISHAGAMIPYIHFRLRLAELKPEMKARVPKGTVHYLQNLYYDTALSTSEAVFAALKEFAKPDHILFGSDYPLLPEPIVQAEVHGIESSKVLDAKWRKAINRDNALKLFPRFASDTNILSRVARSLAGEHA
ncbi:MAG TPA: amidohydrolase family protein [Caulobacterales bacterium]|nr:amidohydrolase family protein [Caulobacterales bacterium]